MAAHFVKEILPIAKPEDAVIESSGLCISCKIESLLGDGLCSECFDRDSESSVRNLRALLFRHRK